MRKKSLALLLVLVMLLGLAAPTALAEEPEDPALTAEESVQEQEEVAVTETVDTSDIALADNDELFAGYVNQLLYPSRGGVSLLANWGSSAGVLNANERDIYNQLKGEIEDVAASGGSTVFQLTAPNITWDTTASGDELRTEAAQQFGAAVSTRDILNCLLVDCPYELYWYDKTNTGGTGWSYGIRAGSGVAMITSLTATLYVAQDYQGRNNTTVNTSKVTAAKTAAGNAQAIVSKYAGKSDYEKLEAYKDEICDLADYNDEAAGSGYTGGYGDPWQIIYVFDDNPSTNVVCEGYAKAFQYLCDLSGLTCYTVSGQMKGGTGAGRHMWNIVTLDGENYLVDVTNCDEGTVGYPDDLFLKAASGSVDGGYTVHGVTYEYDADMVSLYGSGILTLSGSSYTPPAKVTGLTATATYNGTTDDSLTIDVPTKGNTVEVTLTAEATYNNGSTGKVDAEWEFFNGPYYGVSLSGNKLIITPAANYSLIYIGASYGGRESNNILIYLNREDPYAASIEISGPASVTIPTSGSTEAGYTATMENQYGGGYFSPVKWNISGPDGVSVETADNTTEYAKVTVPAGTKPGTATLTAKCGDVSKQFEIDLISKPDAGVTITDAPTEVVMGEGENYFELHAQTECTSSDSAYWGWSSSDPDVLNMLNYSTSGQTVAFTVRVNGPGTATITVIYEDDMYYGEASVEITVLKQPTLSDFTYDLPQSVEYDGSKHVVTVTPKDGITGMGAYTVLYNGGEDEPVNAGTYDVTLRVAKGDTYAAADLDLGSFTIDKATPAITVDNSLTMVKGTTRRLSPTTTPAGLPLEYTSSKPSVAEVSDDGTITAVAEGTAVITVSYAGDNNHEPATATVNVTVTDKNPVTVTFADAADKTYDPNGYKLGEQFSAASAAATTTGGTITYTYNGETYNSLFDLPLVTDAGTYTVTAVYNSDTEYGSQAATFTITKAKPVITVNSSLTMVKGTAQSLGAAITPASLPLDYSSSNPGAATVAPDGTVRGVSVGTAQITISYAGDKNHEPASEVVQVKVIEKIPVNVTFTNAADKTYDPDGYALGAQFSEATVDGDKTITKYIYNGTEYGSLSALPTVTDAGTYTVTAVYESDTEYGEAKATFTIEPKDISTSGSVTLSSTSVTYTGTQAPVSVTSVVMDGHTLTASTDYTVSIPTAINADTYTVTVTGQGNYTGTATAIFEITKATATEAMTTVSADARYGTTGTVAINIAGGTAGTITVSDASNVLNGTPTLNNGVLSFVFVDSEANVDKTATITIPVTGAPNYEDYTITVTVTVVDKFLPDLTVNAITTTYTGSPVSAGLIRGTATYEGKTVKGTWGWTSTVPTNAGTHSVSVTFTPENTDIYANATATVTVTINKATPAGSPGYTSIKESGKTLKDAALTTGSFKVDGEIKWEDSEDTVVQANVSYKWTFTPDDAANYNIVTGSLTPYRVSSDNDSGSSSSGVSKPSTSGGTTTVTTGVTPELSGTTASASVSSSDLNKAVESALETAKDKGTAPAVEIAISTPKRSDTLEVTLPANALEDLGSDREATLTITSGVADVTLDSDAITAVADQAGSKVTLTVAPVKNSDLNKLQREAVGDSPVLSLTLVSGSKVISDFRGGTATVTVSYDLPKGVDAEDVVVWFMDDYGNITPCDTTYNSRTGMLTFETKHFSLYVVGTKSAATTWPFTDVDESHWARTEIAWAYENGYMNGISATTFSPSGTVSRQQVWMILARMAGANPANMAEAKAWSVANGISDGSNPGGAVTRQQLVALLYRFAAQYGYDTTAKADLSSYPDAASLASYATDAMAWSVANGIIGGTTQGTLNPTGTANRGQFAAILWRFYQTTAV